MGAGGGSPTQLMQGGWQAEGCTKGGRGKGTWGRGILSPNPSFPRSQGRRQQPQKTLGETSDLCWISPLNPSPCP